MVTIYSVYDQVADMLARIEPDKVLALKASDDMQERFDFLLTKRNDSVLTVLEKDELDHFIVLERLFRLSKLRADQSNLHAS